MAPFADAVRLVDDEELRLRRSELLECLVGTELLRREEEIFELVIVELVEQLFALRPASASSSARRRSRAPPRPIFSTWSRCSASSGETTTVGPPPRAVASS
jgi:hypothetical protein